MDKTAQGNKIELKPQIPFDINELNPKKIDKENYRQVGVILFIAIAITAIVYAGFRIQQELYVRSQRKPAPVQKQEDTQKINEAQRKSSQDQQRKNDVYSLNSGLKAYFLEKKEAPENLTALTPKIIAKLPVDPQTKQPYIYEVASDKKSWTVSAELSDGTVFEAKGP